ncbi:3'-5' exonuclease [Geodermatophilus sp. SYSU D00758]
MPQIVMGPSQTGTLDSSVKKQAYAFLEKLSTDDTLPGLHIEPINNSADTRVRTGRVNDFYRAVLFKVQGQGDSAHYVYLGVLPHDDAISFARKARLTVNPVNGIAELIVAGDDQPTPEAVAGLAEARPALAEVQPDLVVAQEAPAVALLPALGVDEPALVEDLGIDRSLALAALAATSEDEILGLVEGAVEWQGLALIDLASGTSVQEVKDTLSISDEPEALQPDVGEDQRLLTALQHPAAKMQFAFIEDDDELRRAIEDTDFAAWRVFLHPEQRRYATASYNGPFRLSGGAGTGKTVVLLHRARHLARQNPSARILLTTFTKTLAEAMRADLRRLDPTLKLAERLGDPGIFVSGIDATVSAVLKSAGPHLAVDVEAVLGPRSAEISGRTKDAVWVDAAAAVPELPVDLRSKAFLTSEYAMVVLPARVTSRDDYLTARRPGRGVALDRKKRLAVWSVVEAYRSRASIEGSIDFAEAGAIAAASLERRTAEQGTYRVDHVLVDEGQDLTPSHWQFLRALVEPHADDLFIAEDSHQRIYGQRVVLGRYGIRIVGRSQRLKLNYRTTAQTLRYAVGVLEGEEFIDLEDTSEDSGHYRSARSGPRPRVVECANLTEELEAAAKTVNDWLGSGVVPETIGILVRDAQQAGQVSRGLADRGVEVRLVDQGALRQGQPLVMTMHRAKGMEFARVLIFGVNEGLVPAQYLLKDLTEADRADALTRERSLLYVAATRARDELVITTSGSRSAFLPTV